MATATVASLNTKLTADASGLFATVARSQGVLQGFKSQVGAIAGQLGVIGGGLGVAGFLGWGIKLADDANMAQIKLEAFTGSAATARDILKQLRAASTATPILSFGQMAKEAANLAQNRVPIADIVPVMNAIAIATQGNSDQMHNLAYAYSQVSQAGRLMGQEQVQMLNAGFSPLAHIMTVTGESANEVRARMEAGAVSFAEVTQALLRATEAGTGLHKAFNRVATDPLSGKIAAVQKNFEKLAMTVGTTIIPALNNMLVAIQPLVTGIGSLNVETVQWLLGIGAGVVAFVGLARAAMVVVPAFNYLAGAYKKIIGLQALLTALQGPKGLAVVAGAAIATAVTMGIVSAQMNKAMEEQKKLSKEAQDGINKVAEAQNNLAAANDKVEETLFADITAEKFTRASESVASFVTEFNAIFEMMERGKSITEEFRTPTEKFDDTVRELMSLREAGAITGETFFRAFDDAAKKLRESNTEADKLKQTVQGIGALDMKTSAAFSAIRQIERQARVDQQIEREKEIQGNRIREMLDRIEVSRTVSNPVGDAILTDIKMQQREANAYLKSMASAKNIKVNEVNIP